MELKLLVSDFSFLKRTASPELVNSLGQRIEYKSVILSGEKDNFERLLSALADAFSQSGLNSDDEPNSVGRQIESVIDKCTLLLYE
jgi:hypothetical protein